VSDCPNQRVFIDIKDKAVSNFVLFCALIVNFVGNMKKSGFILGFLLLLGWVQGQTQDPFMRQLTVRDGLPQQQVMCYFKDSRGFLWLGTKGGLSRFDGKTFKNYDEEDGIPHNIVRNIGEDENGDIWFTTILGLVHFDGIKFTVFKNETLGDASITIVNSHKIFVHSSDWVLFENGKYVSKADYFKGIDAQKIIKTYYDKPTGNMYVGCSEPTNADIHLYQNGQLKKVGAPHLDFSHIQRMPTGELLFGRFVKSPIEYEAYRQNSDGTFKLFFRKNHKTLALFEPTPYNMYAGSFWETPQYFIPKGQSGVFKTVAQPIAECPFQFGAYHELYNCYNYASEANKMWVNSGQGIWEISNAAFESIQNQDLSFTWAVTEDKKQHLYFSTFATGQVIEYDGRQFKTIFDKSINAQKIIGFYFGASTDNKGNLYFPHHLGVLKYDGQRFSQVFREPDDVNNNHHIEFSFFDKERNWLISGGFQHVDVLDLSKNSSRTLTPEQGLHESEDTEGVVKDTDGSIWIFGKQGITNWKPETNAFKNYTISNERKMGFGGISGCIDARGTFWLGNTFGLCYFDREKEAFQWLTPELKHYVTAVANYDKDHILFGTADGLIYFLDLKKWYDNKQVALKLFNNDNGYSGGKVQQNGIFKDSKGDFWILSATGLVRLHPEKLNLNQGELPKAYIKQVDTISLRLNYKTDTIKLLRDQNYFNIEAGILFWDSSVKTYFSYRLLGQKDTTWSAWTAATNYFFTDLSSGVYVLEIKARPLGYEETAISRVFVKVDLPLLQEPIFRRFIIALASLLFLGFVFQSIRNGYLNRQLKKNIQTVRQLEVQTLQAQMNPHFIYNILGSLQHVIYQNDTKTAEFLLLRLSRLIRGFLEASVRSNNLKNLNTQNDTILQEEIELLRLYIDFEQFVRKDKFTYTIEVADDIDVGIFTLPPIIIQPYVENAIKHGIFYKEGKGHLSLKFFKRDEDTLICEITDDGVGIEQVKAIQAQSIKSYKSLSTSLILARIERLNTMGYDITVTTENRAEGGTKVQIVCGYSNH
jgi:ligand-binding sensor domain-containing protein